MKQDDLIRIKAFIRVSLDIERMLDVTDIQKKILITLIDCCNQDNKSIPVGDLTISINGVSERSVFRHLKTLIALGWIKLSSSQRDQRVKLLSPTPKLLRVLSRV